MEIPFLFKCISLKYKRGLKIFFSIFDINILSHFSYLIAVNICKNFIMKKTAVKFLKRLRHSKHEMSRI